MSGGALTTGKNAVQALKPNHRAMARYVALGWTGPQIAAHFGMSSSWVNEIIKSPLFQAEVRRISRGLEARADDAVKELEGLVPKAIEILAEDLDNITDRKMRSRTAREVLDRTGYAKKTAEDAAPSTINIIYNIPKPGDSMEDAVQKVKEAKEASVIEAEVVEAS